MNTIRLPTWVGLPISSLESKEQPNEPQLIVNRRFLAPRELIVISLVGELVGLVVWALAGISQGNIWRDLGLTRPKYVLVLFSWLFSDCLHTF